MEDVCDADDENLTDDGEDACDEFDESRFAE
jgi:hypothetical protein